MKKAPFKIILSFLSLCFIPGISSYSQVTVHHKTKRYVGNVTNLKRNKFFNFHMFSATADSDIVSVSNKYNIDLGSYGQRNFGGPFQALANTNNPIGTYRPVGTATNRTLVNGVRKTKRYIDVAAPFLVFNRGQKGVKNGNTNINLDNAAAFVANFYEKETEDKYMPQYYETFNEPFVHAIEYTSFAKSGDPYTPASKIARQNFKTKVSQLTAKITKQIRSKPSLKNLKVMGFASAFPEFQDFNFANWTENQKLFMDITKGAGLDIYSVHLYDGESNDIQAGGVGELNANRGERKGGANQMAILDMIENYSYIINNKQVKPLAITEFGQLVSGAYTAVRNSQSVRTMNSYMFDFLERENNIEVCIPYVTGKESGNNLIGGRASLWVPGTTTESPRAKFYETWKSVKGNRVFIESGDQDILAQAFMDETSRASSGQNVLHVILHNLESQKTVPLNFADGKNGLAGFIIKRIKSPINGIATSTGPTFSSTAPASVTIDFGETVVMEYHFSKAQSTPTKTIRSKKYYAKESLKQLVANTTVFYGIDGVSAGGSGVATLRIGVSRSKNASVSKMPSSVTINGVPQTIPANNYKGYNQSNRNRFFGIVEIPVNIQNLKTNNVIGIKYNNVGTGNNNNDYVSSVILELQKYDGGGTSPVVTPPSSSAIAIPGTIQAENFASKSGDVKAENTPGGGQNLGFVKNGNYTQYNINVANAGSYKVDAFTSSAGTGGNIVISVGGTNLATLAVPVNNAWHNYSSSLSGTVNLAAGVQTLRLTYTGPAGFLFNFDRIKFSASGGAPPSTGNTNSLVGKTISLLPLEASWIANSANTKFDYLSLRFNEGSFLKTSKKANSGSLTAINAWEKFKIEDAGNNNVAIKVYNKYLVASAANSSEVKATGNSATGIGATYSVSLEGDNIVGFKNILTGKYLQVNQNAAIGKITLTLAGAQFGAWEKFEYNVVGAKDLSAITNTLAVKVYPNPAFDIINIATDDNLTFTELYDINGQIVSRNGRDTSIDLSNIEPGVYFLKLSVESSNRVITKKIIKK